MFKTYVQTTKHDVRVEGTLSLCFESKTVLQQGDSLPPILFNLALQ
jgi:hypothetical protein